MCAERDAVELHRLERARLVCIPVAKLGDRGLRDLDGVIRGAAQDQRLREDLSGERALERVLEQSVRLAQMLAGGRDADG